MSLSIHFLYTFLHKITFSTPRQASQNPPLLHLTNLCVWVKSTTSYFFFEKSGKRPFITGCPGIQAPLFIWAWRFLSITLWAASTLSRWERSWLACAISGWTSAFAAAATCEASTTAVISPFIPVSSLFLPTFWSSTFKTAVASANRFAAASPLVSFAPRLGLLSTYSTWVIDIASAIVITIYTNYILSANYPSFSIARNSLLLLDLAIRSTITLVRSSSFSMSSMRRITTMFW